MMLQYQRFQLGGKVEEVEVETNRVNEKQYILLHDVQDVFPTAARFERDGRPVKFMSDENGVRLEPWRIAHHPDAVLQVIPAKQSISAGLAPIEPSPGPSVALLSRTVPMSEEHWRDYLVQRAIKMLILLATSTLTVFLNHLISRWSSRMSGFIMVGLYWNVVSTVLFLLSVVWFLMLVIPVVEVVWFLVSTPILMKRSMYQRLFDF
ncbi:hypothetical protein B0O80DRAFT_457097 [Mortierella sp. GBAus27b]|nr:hypothetical protein BGX31_002957 [Mortierella sp. GBA43]KAI8351110.1 hypothetical protein B0O80DRAFT_457097 [Mortierella sp. GBAus27b]